jgi:hypothetical protein
VVGVVLPCNQPAVSHLGLKVPAGVSYAAYQKQGAARMKQCRGLSIFNGEEEQLVLMVCHMPEATAELHCK